MMRTKRKVSAGLDLIAERKKNPSLGKFLDSLDSLDDIVGQDTADESKPLNRPYSGSELETTERWK
jgi:hypothetical protein